MRNKIAIIFYLVLGFINIHYSQAQNEESLNGTWLVTWSDGNHGPRSKPALARINPEVDYKKYRELEIPGEVHTLFEKEGILGDPHVGLNTLYASWVAEQQYQFYRTFDLPASARGQEQWLIFEELDLVADIYLNGELVGTHNNFFYPCKINVTGKTKPGKNVLVVLLESGMFSAGEKEVKKYGQSRGFLQAIDKRHYLRKPQYQFNWDWNPKFVNVGITGDVKLIWAEKARIDQVLVNQSLTEDFSQAKVQVKSFVEAVKGQKLSLDITIEGTDVTHSKEYAIEEGLQLYSTELELDNPKLWWPVGHGEPFLYLIKIVHKVDGEVIGEVVKKIGFRNVEIDQSPHPSIGSYFTLKVNNRPIFAKGGNWVPPSLKYGLITKERLDSLIDKSLQANFNLLRIWGGGMYPGTDFLSLCDEKGILLWHDFMFACMTYPGDDQEFYENVRKEVTWVSREYGHHPSIVIWGGNNEIEMIHYDANGPGYNKVTMKDQNLYHHLIPMILSNEGSNAFYWPSSPYSPNFKSPKDPYSGDQHPWGVGFWADSINFWAYRKYEDRFADEGGVLGATSPKTLKQAFGEDFNLRSITWDHHDNLMNFRNNKLGYNYQQYEMFMGKKYQSVSTEEYVLGSGLLQSEALQEFINNYHRRIFSSSAAVFWMYNDSWPTTHGWTIIDYYLREKLAFHPVKRAFEPITVVIAEEEDSILVFGVNETAEGVQLKLNYGLASFDGKQIDEKEMEVNLPALASTQIATIDKSIWEEWGTDKSAAFARLMTEESLVAQHRLFLKYYGELDLAKPKVSVKRDGDKAVFSAQEFVWSVVIDKDGDLEVSDNCFDLIPGKTYEIPWAQNKPLPKVIITGNELVRE